MTDYDSIVIGAGHNGLVCAAYLARAGQRVLVLEAAEQAGGLAATREFHPGFQTSVAHSLGHFSASVASDLGLEFAKAQSPLALVGLGADGANVRLDHGELQGVADADLAAWPEFRRLMRRCADALAPFWSRTIPGIGNNSLPELFTFARLGLRLRGMGKKDMREFLRIASLPARDLVDEHFENEQLKAMLSWDGLLGGKMAPRSPNAAVLVMLYRMAGGAADSHLVPAGGTGQLAQQLAGAAQACGAEVRCSSPVGRIEVQEDSNGLQVSGVRLATGETISASRVISATDPQRTFFDLLGVDYLDIGFSNRIRRLRCEGQVAKLHLALDALPQFTGLEQPAGRMLIAPDLDSIEFAWDDAKYGRCSEQPVMEIVLPSLLDETLASSGHHLLSAHVMYVPYKLKGGWTGEARQAFRQRCIDTLEQYAPGIRDSIIAGELLTPADLESEYRVTGGHWHHTEFAMDQMLMMRPTYGAAQYATPVPGLWLCGAGSHPGGDLTGLPGHNAAQEILR